MKKSNLFIIAVLCIIGLLMLINPVWCVKAVVVLLGIEAVANGVYNLMYIRKLVPDSSFQYTIICRGMTSVVIGLLAFFLPLRFAEIMWTVMLYVLAIYLIFGAILEMYAMGKIRDTEIDRKQFIFEAIISIAAAIVMLIIPLKIGNAVIRIGGLIVLLIAGIYFVYSWKNRPIVQQPVEVVDDISGTIE